VSTQQNKIALVILMAVMALLLPACNNIRSYSMQKSQSYGDYITIFADGKPVAKITPKYTKELAKISIFKDDKSRVASIYTDLIDRANIAQPKPFDDITGDGKPNLICIERQRGSVNQGPYPVAIRFFTLDGKTLIEHRPIITKVGEVIYFADFNKDGILEFVNTDQEKSFHYLSNGLPNSPLVWYWDSSQQQYRKSLKH
jgi:antitoxin (DNA-binding transcriptional repressor) of toxin-antitoxin stability system